jgi:hypothetical protein
LGIKPVKPIKPINFIYSYKKYKTNKERPMKFPNDGFTEGPSLSDIEEGPEGETSLQLLQNVYRDRKQPLNVRVRCAVESLVHEYPKLSAVAHGHFDGKTYADALEAELRAIERSKRPLPLAGPGPTIEHDPEELKGPFTRLERRF